MRPSTLLVFGLLVLNPPSVHARQTPDSPAAARPPADEPQQDGNRTDAGAIPAEAAAGATAGSAAGVDLLAQVPPPPTGPAERAVWLVERIDAILALPALKDAKLGVAVADLDGRMLYARNADALLNPASNVKIVTTAAALALLGPEYRFKTVIAAGGVRGTVVDGDIYVKGYGDPALVGEELWKIASDLGARGIKRITGDLVVDDSYFDGERLGPGFAQKEEDLPFRAPNGALSLNYNACSIRIAPGGNPGDPARVSVDPMSPYFVIVNQARTTTGKHTSLHVTTRPSGDAHTEVLVSGTIGSGAPAVAERRRIVHPDWYAGYSLREILSRRGIRVLGQVRLGTVPPNARTLVTHYSQPLGVLVRDINKISNNFMAEQLLKTLGAHTAGAPGTSAHGVDAVARYLSMLGLKTSDYRMSNGSGLYDSNRFSANQIVTLLRAAYRDFRFSADFVGSLALAGADGTIEHRMAESETERYVRAKTGTLDGVSCLSGYAGAPARLPLVFAILMNDLNTPGVSSAKNGATAEARRAQDAVARVLVRYLMGK